MPTIAQFHWNSFINKFVTISLVNDFGTPGGPILLQRISNNSLVWYHFQRENNCLESYCLHSQLLVTKTELQLLWAQLSASLHSWGDYLEPIDIINRKIRLKIKSKYPSCKFYKIIKLSYFNQPNRQRYCNQSEH